MIRNGFLGPVGRPGLKRAVLYFIAAIGLLLTVFSLALCLWTLYFGSANILHHAALKPDDALLTASGVGFVMGILFLDLSSFWLSGKSSS